MANRVVDPETIRLSRMAKAPEMKDTRIL